jgi:hypothetical protein
MGAREIAVNVRFKKIVAVLNFTLGAALWLFACTDFRLAGTIPNIVFPPLAGVIGLVSWIAVKERFLRWLCVPSVIGGGLYVLTGLLLFVSPFTLGTLFALSEIGHERRIQESVSPDGSKIAGVYFRGVGAYSGGNGRIFVRIKYRFFPLIERTIFYRRVSVADEHTSNYLRWAGDRALYISEIDQEILIPNVRLQTPAVMEFPVAFVRYFIIDGRRDQIDRKLTIPVSDVPTFPGTMADDQSEYDDALKTAFRSFNIPGHTPDEIAEWYRNALSKPPWSVVQVNRSLVQETFQESGPQQVRYCIQSQRQEESHPRVYFWEIMGRVDGSLGTHINIGTPNPITDICRAHELPH